MESPERAGEEKDSADTKKEDTLSSPADANSCDERTTPFFSNLSEKVRGARRLDGTATTPCWPAKRRHLMVLDSERV